MHYKSKDFFALRTPMFSIEKYEQLTNSKSNMEEQILSFINNSVFMEGIAIASPDLYSEIMKAKKEKSILTDKKIYRSLLKYAIRGCTRTTPFGLFCGFSIGYFGKMSNISLADNEEYVKRARADMEWIVKVTTMLENDTYFMQKTMIYSNDLVYKKGERVINPYLADRNFAKQNRKEFIISVKYTNLLNDILIMCENGEVYEEVVNKIRKNKPDATRDQVIMYLQNLICNGFLISELRASKSNIEPLQNLEKCLKKRSSEIVSYETICEVKKLIISYNNTGIGRGIDAIKKIENLMSKIARVNNYIQVDYKAVMSECNLGEGIKSRCEQIIEKMIMLGSFLPELNYFQTYKQRFNEKYGCYREIPILELLDEEMGIGAPDSYIMPQNRNSFTKNTSVENNEFKTQLKQFIISKVLLALENGKREIVITDDDMSKFEYRFKDNANVELPTSVDMYFFIHAKEGNSIDKGEYELAIGPSGGIDKSGRTIGRFSDMLNQQEERDYNSLFLENKELSKEEYILVDLDEEPLMGRAGNVVLNKNIAEYQTVLGCVANKNINQISVKDVLVGIDGRTNELYLKSKSLNRKIKYVSFNMLNPLIGSNIHRFMREISNINELNFVRVIQDILIKEFVYIPRIKYLNCILIPSTWKLSLNELKNPKNLLEFKDKFIEWKQMWLLPNSVYYKKGDDLFKLNLKSEDMIEELYRVLKKSESVELVDYGNDDFWVENKNKEKFSSEFIMSFFKVPETTEKPGIENVLKSSSCLSKNQEYFMEVETKRRSAPGENGWWYFKLYGTDLDTIICEKILFFCKKKLKENVIESFYYIRYADPELHVRLRIKLPDGHNIINNNVLIMWLKELEKNCIVKEYTINIYEREFERYGGVIPFQYVEKFFYYDSLYIAELLAIKRDDNINEKLVVMSNLLILNIFNYDLMQQLSLFEINYGKLNLYKKKFRKELKDYIKIYELLDKMIPIRNLVFNNIEQQNSICKLMQMRNKQLENYVSVLRDMDGKGNLTNSFDDIVLSIMHMHCNRFNGDRIWEYKTIELSYRAIYAFRNYKKNTMNREE